MVLNIPIGTAAKAVCELVQYAIDDHHRTRRLLMIFAPLGLVVLALLALLTLWVMVGGGAQALDHFIENGNTLCPNVAACVPQGLAARKPLSHDTE